MQTNVDYEFDDYRELSWLEVGQDDQLVVHIPHFNMVL